MRLHRLLTKPSNVQKIASGEGITVSERARLNRTYGVGRWRKMKGRARVELESGWIGWAEVHWYDAQGIGPVDWKIKRTWETP